MKPPDITVIEHESQNLALHVDLCAQRYALLEHRLDTIETKVENIGVNIASSQRSLSTVIITSAASIVVALISAVALILVNI